MSDNEKAKMPELDVNGQFTNNELRVIQRFVDDVNELVIVRSGLIAFIFKQRQEVLLRERQLLDSLTQLSERTAEVERLKSFRSRDRIHELESELATPKFQESPADAWARRVRETFLEPGYGNPQITPYIQPPSINITSPKEKL